MPVPDTIEDRVRDAAPKLDQIPKQSVLVCVHSYIVIGCSTGILKFLLVNGLDMLLASML